MARKRKTDLNHKEIRDGLRSVPGVSVFDCYNIGNGFPDLVVGHRGKNFLIEVKSKNGTLTDQQDELISKWKGSILVALTLEDALKGIGVLK